MKIAKTYRVKSIDNVQYQDEVEKPLIVGSIVFEHCGAFGFTVYPKDNDATVINIPFDDLEPVIHHEMVKDLAKDPVAIAKYLAPDSDGCHIGAINLMHMIVGIGDEYFETLQAIILEDPENILEELGDLLFYTEGLLLQFPIPRDTVRATSVAPLSWVDTMQLLFETGKRHVFYEKELIQVNLIRVYNSLVALIEETAELNGFSFEQVQDANMVKLGVRYRDFCYSDKAAHARVDKQAEQYKKDKEDFNNAQSDPCIGAAVQGQDYRP